jgi:hypothetical protein
VALRQVNLQRPIGLAAQRVILLVALVGSLLIVWLLQSGLPHCPDLPHTPDTGLAAFRFCHPHGGIVQLRYGPVGYGVRCRDRSWFWREKGRVDPIKIGGDRLAKRPPPESEAW